MQIKTIETVIIKKLEDWLSSIEDISLRAEVRDSLLVSGGSISSMLLNEPVNDYDIYLQDIDVCKKLAQYYSKNFSNITILNGRNKEQLIKDYNEKNSYKVTGNIREAIELSNYYATALRNLKGDQIKLIFEGADSGLKANQGLDLDTPLYLPLFFSPNAISLSNDIQIVLRFTGAVEQIHKTFDFVHATNYFTFKDGLVRNLNAVESILTKQLKYQGSLYPVTSIIRVKKFVKRGYNISAGELLKIMFQISQLDLSDPDTLEEQLIGVDVVYFDLLIQALRNKLDKDNKFVIIQDYFNKLVDKIFNESSLDE